MESPCDRRLIYCMPVSGTSARDRSNGAVHDVAVVGAGVIGLSVAYHAAARGLKTIVCERTRIAGDSAEPASSWRPKSSRGEP
jgi:NADPH-dependent 2,4-dienoyl-CoA reductase/sulfur reductase-like enzyme